MSDRDLDPEGDRVRAEVAPRRPSLSGQDRWLLLATLAGPLAWCVQLAIDLPMVRPLCKSGTVWPLHAVTAAALVVTLLGLAYCWPRRGGHDEQTPSALLAAEVAGTATPPAPLVVDGGARVAQDAPAQVRGALAWAGVGLGLFFVLLVIASDVPGFILEPCK
ncbi:MAG TPA: hypothetical protein VGS57_10785 [Thermoanaerobaculia bacterium]|nr:hypothetical protein [Thermoanaerobaculia bacterium]